MSTLQGEKECQVMLSKGPNRSKMCDWSDSWLILSLIGAAPHPRRKGFGAPIDLPLWVVVFFKCVCRVRRHGNSRESPEEKQGFPRVEAKSQPRGSFFVLAWSVTSHHQVPARSSIAAQAITVLFGKSSVYSRLDKQPKGVLSQMKQLSAQIQCCLY